MKKTTLLLLSMFFLFLTNTGVVKAQVCPPDSKCYGWAKTPSGFYGMPEKTRVFPINYPRPLGGEGDKIISVTGSYIHSYKDRFLGHGRIMKLMLKEITKSDDLPWLKVVVARPYTVVTRKGHFHFYVDGGHESDLY